jgi:uncharacterized membrane protein
MSDLDRRYWQLQAAIGIGTIAAISSLRIFEDRAEVAVFIAILALIMLYFNLRFAVAFQAWQRTRDRREFMQQAIKELGGD